MPVRVKVCGVTSIDDARGCIEACVDAIGVNLVPTSPRCVDRDTARAIAAAIGTRALCIGVTADLSVDTLRALRDDLGLGCLQLHGDEPPETIEALLPRAYKAIRVGSVEDASRADLFPGAHLLVDGRVSGVLGGTGVRVDPSLVAALARRRKLTLAGGLSVSNVAAAIAAVGPWAVDVASGVEVPGNPRKKDLRAVAAFVAAVRAASP